MEIRDLKYLEEIINTGSFSKAAENLFLSQPALSRSMKRLEDELDINLFERKGSIKRLSTEGREFFDHAKRVLEAEQELIKWLEFSRRKRNHQVRIGIIPYYVTPWTTEVFYAFQQKYPDTELMISEMPDRWIEEKLLSGEIDVGMTERALNNSELKLCGGYWDSIDIAFSRKSTLWDKEHIVFSDLKDEMFHVITSDSPLGDMVVTEAGKAGFRPKIGYMGSQVGMLLAHLVEKGGVCLLNATILRCNIEANPIFSDNIRQQPLDPILPCYCWVYTRNQQQSSDVSALVAFLCHELEMDIQFRIC